MALFREDQGALKCRFLGENLWLLPWGKNALRVVSRPMSEPELPAWALLDPEKTESDIEISEREASIAVGKIKAVVRRMDWPDRLEITYYNQKGEELLAEKKGKKGHRKVMKQINLIDFIYDMKFSTADNIVNLQCVLAAGNANNLNPTLLIETLEKQIGVEHEMVYIVRRKLITKDNKTFK